MSESDKARLERNKAVALRFKKSQGTPEMPQVEREVLAANYDRARGGSFHLAANARDQNWPHPGMYLRTSFPDRVDVIERVVAEGDRSACFSASTRRIPVITSAFHPRAGKSTSTNALFCGSCTAGWSRAGS